MNKLTIRKIWATLKKWQEVSRQRRELSKLSDDLLKDIGLSKVDAEREVNRPFWDSRQAFDPSLRRHKEVGTFNRNHQRPNLCCFNG